MNPNQRALLGLLLGMLFQVAVLLSIPVLVIGGILWALWKWWN